MLTNSLPFDCPWCGEANVVECDPEEAGHSLIQDCIVCCSPIELKIPLTEYDALIVQREGE